jgi:hypothetical protein
MPKPERLEPFGMPSSIRDVLPVTALEGLSLLLFGDMADQIHEQDSADLDAQVGFTPSEEYRRADYHTGNVDALDFTRAFRALPAANREKVSEFLYDLWFSEIRHRDEGAV